MLADTKKEKNEEKSGAFGHWKGSTNKRKKERVGSGESEREGARPA